MKFTFLTIALVSLPAFAADQAKSHRYISSSTSAKPGHFFCTETEGGMDTVEKALEGACDPSKAYSVTVYSDSGSYSNYGLCCIHK